MSRKLISRSPDLQRLRSEGYDIEVRSGRFLLVKSIPYVNANREIALGTLVSTLNLAGEATAPPDTHVVTWIGEHPCRPDGSAISSIQNSTGRQELDRGLVVDYTFSNKLTGNQSDPDYYEKMTRYTTIISGQAQAIDPSATPKVNRFVDDVEEDSPFVYADTASSTDGIAAVSRKLEQQAVAIVGLGGTGSYILDLVAKTPVRAIHLFDGDPFLQHNAFRSPGAASIEALRAVPDKVEYHKTQYSNMHRGIVTHGDFLDYSNLDDLRGMEFAFLCLDRGQIKKEIVARLMEWRIPFIDATMGIELVDDALGGILTVTTVTPEKSDHWQRRLTFSDANPNNDYSKNIQIADLNALNASLAVIKWKKHLGFYRDLRREHHSSYTTDVDMLLNDDETA
jgi:uncharacterized protein DUF6791/ThiF family protein